MSFNFYHKFYQWQFIFTDIRGSKYYISDIYLITQLNSLTYLQYLNVKIKWKPFFFFIKKKEAILVAVQQSEFWTKLGWVLLDTQTFHFALVDAKFAHDHLINLMPV